VAEAVRKGEPVRCTRCRTVLGVWRGDAIKVKVQSRAIFIKGGVAEVRCHECRMSTQLPLITPEHPHRSPRTGETLQDVREAIAALSGP